MEQSQQKCISDILTSDGRPVFEMDEALEDLIATRFEEGLEIGRDGDDGREAGREGEEVKVSELSVWGEGVKLENL